MKQTIVEFDDNIIIKFQSDGKERDYPRFKMRLWSEMGVMTIDIRLQYCREEIIKIRNFFNSIKLPEEEE
ncbi:hypothetical protein LCGC14_1851670 [marine sediment metagenome]|uniref:Uncharacterized protein n=1 Tax=marine sediment metagenome TaxID=412755 RepID=A0A0F9GYD9_9ZZZZ